MPPFEAQPAIYNSAARSSEFSMLAGGTPAREKALNKSALPGPGEGSDADAALRGQFFEHDPPDLSEFRKRRETARRLQAPDEEPEYGRVVKDSDERERLSLDRLPLQEELSEYLNANFDRLDRDRNGLIIDDEIRVDLATTRTPEDKKFLSILAGDGAISAGFSSGGPFSAYGITRDGIQAMSGRLSDYYELRKEQRKRLPDIYSMCDFGYTNFHSIDRGKGYITQQDLDLAITNAGNESERRSLSHIRENFNALMDPQETLTLTPGTSFRAIYRAFNYVFPKPGIMLSDFETFLKKQYIKTIASEQPGMFLRKAWKMTDLEMLSFQNRRWLEEQYRVKQKH